MMNVLFGLMTALLVAIWGVAWYRQQSPAAVARGRLAQPPRTPRPAPMPAPSERVDRLVPLVEVASEPEMERIEEPFFAESAPPRPRRPLRLRYPVLTPIPEGPRLDVEPLTADERLGDFTPPRPLAEPEPPVAVAADAVAAAPDEVVAVPTPPTDVTMDAEDGPEPLPAAPVEATAAADDLGTIEEPFFATPTAPVPAPPVETPLPAPPVAEAPASAPTEEAPLDGIAEPFFGGESAPTPDLVGYCARCQAKRSVRDVTRTTTRKGRPALRGHCVTCGAGMFIFVADER